MTSPITAAIRRDLETHWSVPVRTPDGVKGMLTLMSSTDSRVQFYDHERFSAAVGAGESKVAIAQWTTLAELGAFIDEHGLVPEQGYARANAERVLEALDAGKSVVVSAEAPPHERPLLQLTPAENRPAAITVVSLDSGTGRDGIVMTSLPRAALSIVDDQLVVGESGPSIEVSHFEPATPGSRGPLHQAFAEQLVGAVKRAPDRSAQSLAIS